MRTELIALTEGPNISLEKTIVVFGRHPECDVQLNSRKVSRRHCVIANLGGRLVIRDLGSTNGVRVNGERQDNAEVRNGDELVIGGFRFQVSCATACKPPMPITDQSLDISQMATRRLLLVSEGELERADQPIPLDESMVLPPKRRAVPPELSPDSLVIPEYLRGPAPKRKPD